MNGNITISHEDPEYHTLIYQNKDSITKRKIDSLGAFLSSNKRKRDRIGPKCLSRYSSVSQLSLEVDGAYIQCSTEPNIYKPIQQILSSKSITQKYNASNIKNLKG